MIMNGVKENIPRLWTKITLKKKTVKVAELKSFQNSCWLIWHNIAHLGNVADLGNSSGLFELVKW